MSDYSTTIQDELQQYQQYAAQMSAICVDIVAARKANAEKALKHKQMLARLRMLIIVAVLAAVLGGGFIYLNGRFAKLTAQAQAAVDRGDYAAAYHVYDNESLAGIMWGQHGALYHQVKETYEVRNCIEEAQNSAAAGAWRDALQTVRDGLSDYSDNQELLDVGDEIAAEAISQLDENALGGTDGVVAFLNELASVYPYGDGILSKEAERWQAAASEQQAFESSAFDQLDYRPDVVLARSDWQTATVATQKTGLFMRTGPGQDYGKLQTIPKGKMVYIVAYGNNVEPWVCVMYDGVCGWVSGDYLR